MAAVVHEGRPAYQDIRVFYDVTENVVGLLAIVTKIGAAAWSR